MDNKQRLDAETDKHYSMEQKTYRSIVLKKKCPEV